MRSPDLFAKAPLPWTAGRGPELEQDTNHVYDAQGVWVAEVRMGTGLAPLVRTSPELLEELQELAAFFRGFKHDRELVTREQAQAWAARLEQVLERAKGGVR